MAITLALQQYIVVAILARLRTPIIPILHPPYQPGSTQPQLLIG
ncbi:hypothetical protein FOCG_18286 [Fusarium oxysporum f. sp. radicis-lycopersici 26381]|nr:hypothetical protein FOCG_18286 [Fusarium oxysporum f. sp. radicis-lycopersici 26381]